MKLIFLTLFSTLAFGSECLKVKTAFDIGSGATKMKVARVDICLQKIDKILLDTHEPVKYKESLQNSPDNKLNRDILNQGVEALKKLKKKAAKFSPESYEAVATSAFRTAANGQEAAEFIAQRAGINFKIISQEEEAKLGFVGASQIADKDLKNLVVWDIGGGSMQMTVYQGISAGKNRFHIYRGKMASASFKKHIVKEVLGKDPVKVKSPNPIGLAAAKRALRDARLMADATVGGVIKNKIKSGATVVGIGGAHFYSVKGQTGARETYSLELLKNTVQKAALKKDSEIGGDYASTDASNLILVQGFMEALGIKKVRVGKINLADGILLGGTR